MTAMNSMRTIVASIESLAGLAEVVLVVDSGSTDGTIEACRARGAIVESKAWAGHVAQKQWAIQRAETLLAERCPTAERWTLLLDSDEAVDPVLCSAIEERLAGRTSSPAASGYDLRRRLVLHGRELVYAYQPEFRTRLFRSGMGRVVGTPPHDRIEVEGPIAALPGHLRHDSWADVADMLRRQLAYAEITARDPHARGGGAIDLLVRPGAAFLKQLVLRSAWRDGWRGFVVAGGAAAATLMKHLVLAERAGRTSKGEPS
jgi:glycosyltransferase involved in cell wall biosynthesis